MDQIKIGRFIAKLRKEQKMTQFDLATKIGVTDRAISKWENGRGLPDISIISALCEALEISIDELLEGERIENSEKLKIAHKNLLNILGEREREIKKAKSLKLLISVLSIIVIFICVMFTPMLYAQFRGDGYSFSAAYATQLANSVSKSILKGEFSKASKSIGFVNKNRAVAENQWALEMENLFKEDLSIRQLTVSRMIENDRFVSGNATMIIYNYISDKKYVFDFQIAFDDGGIAFMGCSDNIEDGREKEIMLRIENTICTYYAG